MGGKQYLLGLYDTAGQVGTESSLPDVRFIGSDISDNSAWRPVCIASVGGMWQLLPRQNDSESEALNRCPTCTGLNLNSRAALDVVLSLI